MQLITPISKRYRELTALNKPEIRLYKRNGEISFNAAAEELLCMANGRYFVFAEFHEVENDEPQRFGFYITDKPHKGGWKLRTTTKGNSFFTSRPMVRLLTKGRRGSYITFLVSKTLHETINHEHIYEIVTE